MVTKEHVMNQARIGIRELLLLAYLSEFVSNDLHSKTRIWVQLFTQYSVKAHLSEYLRKVKGGQSI
jgi:hypothetical protein